MLYFNRFEQRPLLVHKYGSILKMIISLAVRSSPIIFSNMGSTLSKKLNDRGRKQRSAAERLVDSRKQGETQFF